MASIPSLDQSIDTASLDAAAEVSRRFFAVCPEAAERYGEHGRAYTDHDNAYLVRWARDAVELGSSAVFEHNVRWILDLLVARDFPAEWFLRDLDLVIVVAIERGLVAPADADAFLGPVLADLRDVR